MHLCHHASKTVDTHQNVKKNQPPHFLCVTWMLLRLMAPAIQTAPSVLLKHCDYSGKCQGSPGSHLIFCLPKTAAKKNRARNVPHTGRKPDRQSYRMWHGNEKLAIMQSASPSLLCECTLCVRARRVIISTFWPWLRLMKHNFLSATWGLKGIVHHFREWSVLENYFTT